MSGTPVRLQLSRRKGFGLQAVSLATNGLPAVSVARPSKWGNPFRVGAERGLAAADKADAVRRYRRWLQRMCTANGREFRKMLSEHLHGKNLACWCKLPNPGEPDICHASVLLEIANK